MTAAEYNRARNRQRRRAGLCRDCAEAICLLSVRFCVRHLIEARRRQRQYDRRRRGNKPWRPGGPSARPSESPTLADRYALDESGVG